MVNLCFKLNVEKYHFGIRLSTGLTSTFYSMFYGFWWPSIQLKSRTEIRHSKEDMQDKKEGDTVYGQ
jgi:hypothetical protein